MILPVGKWTPTRTGVLAAEAKLPSSLAPGVRVDGRLIPLPRERLSRYKRQYVGEGRPPERRMVVYLNCRLEGWPHRIAWARGGGACFIRATWDPARGEFIEIVANSGR